MNKKLFYTCGVSVSIKRDYDCMMRVDGFECGACHKHLFKRPKPGQKCLKCGARITVVSFGPNYR